MIGLSLGLNQRKGTFFPEDIDLGLGFEVEDEFCELSFEANLEKLFH